jgi:hypothetical protein
LAVVELLRMPKTFSAASHNGKVHTSRVLATPAKLSAVLVRKPSHSRLSVSLDVLTARKVRDRAFTERTSDSAVVEAALREFFAAGSATNLQAILVRLGIAPRRRKA